MPTFAHGLLLFALLGAPGGTDDEQAGMAERHQRFLEEVALLMNDAEREVFLDLSRAYQRDAFIERFWQERDPFPETARNEFLDRWTEAAAAAREAFDDLDDERARIMLLNGAPNRRIEPRCSALRQLELWFFTDSPLIHGEFALIFVRRGSSYQLWSPYEGLGSLVLFGAVPTPRELAQLIDRECTRGSDILTALSIAVDWREVETEIEVIPQTSGEWAQSFLSYSTDLPEGAELLSGELSVDYPGRYQSRTVVQTMVAVAADQATVGTTGKSYNLLVDGEVLRRGELFEHFRYRYDFPLEEGEGPQETIPIVLQRYLRPGTYTLIVKLQDLNSDRYFRASQEIEVPNVGLSQAAAADIPPSIDAGPLAALSEANATLAGSGPTPAEDQSIRLATPADRLLTGRLRIAAHTTGDGIARVAFELNSKPIFSKASPPYSVEIDLGKAPRVHTLRASALDAEGQVVASDEILLNSGPHRFSIRLIEPERGRRYLKSVRAVAEVEVPELERLERVEFYLNETLIATLYQPPFVQPILIPPDQPLSYVRALGVLKSGASAEDVVFVNSPNPIDEVQVNFVELYTSVLDAKGRPAEGLSGSDFRVLEGGKEQQVRRFELVRDLPIHAGILLDTSTSMTDRLEEAEEAAMHFFQLVLTPRDRACLLTFNDRPELEARFTNSVEVLAGGLAGLVAEGETALYDSLVYALYYFSGIKGKRALILLSDGEDVSSRYEFEEVLEFARRVGVAIYSIGLSIPSKEIDIRSKLTRLCRETGGSCFFIERAAELKSVYTRIERELRSQYLIAYQSSEPGREDRFREVEIEVAQPGLKAKTMRGYYP